MRHRNFGAGNNIGLLGMLLVMRFWWTAIALILIVAFPWLLLLVGIAVATVIVIYVAMKPPPEPLVVEAPSNTDKVATEHMTATNTYVIGDIYYFSVDTNTWQKMRLVGVEDDHYYAEVPLPQATTVFKYKYIKEKF